MATHASAPLPTPRPEKLAGWTLQRLPEPAPVEHVGKLFVGRYMLSRKIGGGGMSTIYEARDVTLGVRVVVKIMRGDLPSDPVDRFRREALVLARLSHEHIGRIIDRQDPEDGPRFLVADYIDGLDLSVLRRRGPVPAAVVVQLGLQVSAALAYAHAEGVIHRDVKPSNIMLVRHPGGDVFAKVIDFGIAKLARGSDLADGAPAGARRETRGDVVPGTAPYWSGREGPQRDVYALALSLAELLTGEDPDPAADLAREHIPLALANAITAALHAELTTMDALHGVLREAIVEAPDDAEAERRRYLARVFGDPSPDEAPVVGRTAWFAGRYIFGGELGEGGMGRVRSAFDTVNRRRVALKTIRPRCAGMVHLEDRFRREGWALAAIEHPGVPILFESSAEPEPFFTMEIVDGVALTAVLRQGKVEPLRALGLAIDLAGILHAAHGVGVIHRDVKPDNVVLGTDDRVRLLDFGACLLMPRFYQRHLMYPATPTAQRYATGELETVGTPGYTAPEVLEMRGGIGPRSDIYSVCVVLYEMLTGRRYESPATGRAPPIDRGEFPAALGPIADVLRRGTAREPGERPWSMADLVRVLEIIHAGLLRARRQRSVLLVAVAAVAATTVILGLVLHLVVGGRTVGELPAVSPHDALAAAAPTPPPGELRADERPAERVGIDVEPPSAPPAGPPATGSNEVAQVDTTDDAPPALNSASVRARVLTRRDRLAKCGAPLLVLDLTITAGQPELSAVNGMSAGDHLHTCASDALRGLAFSARKKPQKFIMTINLGPRVK